MDYNKLIKRLNLESISRFLLYGDEDISNTELNIDTLYKRIEKSEDKIDLIFNQLYKDILNEDWSLLNEKQIQLKIDDLTEAIIMNMGLIEDSYFELGLKSGFIISQKICGL